MPRSISRHLHTRADNIGAGFTLLELTVVVVVLGILSSVSLPRIGNLLSAADVDAAKALLNSAAASCLQNSRLNTDDKELIDDAIISDKRLNPIGFQIDKKNSADKCSYFQLLPTDTEDNIRFPIGFSVSDGALSKFANPTSTDKGSINACETWAGVNCKQDESLKELVNWKKEISSQRKICEENYTNWLTKTNTTPFRFQRWNPNAESGCPVRPPTDGSDSYKKSTTCTPNGCNRVVYGLDGAFVGFTKQEYDLALEAKYGRACSEWISQKEIAKYTNNPTNKPLSKSPECGGRKFWFVDGTDHGSQDGLNAALLEKASKKCELEREKARSEGFVGKWGPKEGPGTCAEESYICDKKIMSEYDYYKNCGYARAKCRGLSKKEDPVCTDYELSDYWYKKCGPRPNDPEPNNCRYVGMGRPYDATGWDKTPQCAKWAKCINLY